MTKAELERDMRRYCGGSSFITLKGLQDYLGYKDRHSAKPYLAGLEKVGSDRFYIGDVARNILSLIVRR